MGGHCWLIRCQPFLILGTFTQQKSAEKWTLCLANPLFQVTGLSDLSTARTHARTQTQSARPSRSGPEALWARARLKKSWGGARRKGGKTERQFRPPYCYWKQVTRPASDCSPIEGTKGPPSSETVCSSGRGFCTSQAFDYFCWAAEIANLPNSPLQAWIKANNWWGRSTQAFRLQCHVVFGRGAFGLGFAIFLFSLEGPPICPPNPDDAPPDRWGELGFFAVLVCRSRWGLAHARSQN